MFQELIYSSVHTCGWMCLTCCVCVCCRTSVRGPLVTLPGATPSTGRHCAPRELSRPSLTSYRWACQVLSQLSLTSYRWACQVLSRPYRWACQVLSRPSLTSYRWACQVLSQPSLISYRWPCLVFCITCHMIIHINQGTCVICEIEE